MSSRTLELLRLVGLLDHHDRVEDLSGLGKEQLRGVLSYYASKRLEAARLDVDKAAGGGARLCAVVSSVSCRNAVFPLLPSCLVYDKLYIDDPVFCTRSGRGQFPGASPQGDAGLPIRKDAVS